MDALVRGLVAALLAWLAAIAFAQDYPAKPVRIVVPFPPSGAADLLTRALGKRLSETWSQPVIADNRPGAGGNIGAEAVARSTPDGYTLLMGAVTTHAVSMTLYSKLGYDLEKDLAPVSLVADGGEAALAQVTSAAPDPERGGVVPSCSRLQGPLPVASLRRAGRGADRLLLGVGRERRFRCPSDLTRVHSYVCRGWPGRVEAEAEHEPEAEREHADVLRQVFDDAADADVVRPGADVPLEPVRLRLAGQ